MPPPDSSSNTRVVLDELRGILLARLRPSLLDELQLRLKVQQPSRVVGLAERELERTALKDEELRPWLKTPGLALGELASAWLKDRGAGAVQEVGEAEFIADCDRVALAIQPDAPVRALEDLRSNCRERWLIGKGKADTGLEPNRCERFILRRIRTRFPMLAANPFDLAPIVDFVDRGVFLADPGPPPDDGFARRCKSYDPEQGRTFDQYVAQMVMWRVDEYLKRQRSLPQSVSIDGGEESGGPALGSTQPAASPGRRSDGDELLGWLADLCELGSIRNPKYGETMAVVVEVYHKAYLHPDDYLKVTKKRLRRGGRNPLPGMVREYLQCLEDFRKLVGDDIPRAREKTQETAQALLHLWETRWSGAGERERFAKLTSQGRWLAVNSGAVGEVQSQIAEYRRVVEHGRSPYRERSAKRVGELEVVLAALQHERARCDEFRLLDTDSAYRRYLRREYPWVRQQTEMEGLLEIDQSTIWRLLTEFDAGWWGGGRLTSDGAGSSDPSR